MMQKVQPKPRPEPTAEAVEISRRVREATRQAQDQLDAQSAEENDNADLHSEEWWRDFANGKMG